MKSIIDAALDRGRMVLLLLAMIFVTGAITYAHIPKESNPDVPIPYIYTAVMYEGISPEDAAVFWTALFDGLVVAWLVKGETLDFDRLLPAIFRLLWRGMAPASHNDNNTSAPETSHDA